MGRKLSADAVANTVAAIPAGAKIPLITTDPDNKYITAENLAADADFAALYQPLDATLTSLSALGTVADRFVYTTALDTWAEAPVTAFGRSLLDDADAAAARTTLGVDPAGTDNSTNVTLAGALDYLTIAGQVITLNAVDLTTDVTGALPIANAAFTDQVLGTTDSPTFAGLTLTGNLALGSGTITTAGTASLGATTVTTLDVGTLGGGAIGSGTRLTLSRSGGLTTGDDIGSLSFKTNDSSFTGAFADGIGAEISAYSTSATGASYGLRFYASTTAGADRQVRLQVDNTGATVTGNLTVSGSGRIIVADGSNIGSADLQTGLFHNAGIVYLQASGTTILTATATGLTTTGTLTVSGTGESVFAGDIKILRTATSGLVFDNLDNADIPGIEWRNADGSRTLTLGIVPESNGTFARKDMLFKVKGVADWTTPATEVMRLTTSRNLLIATTTDPASAVGALVLGNGTAPSAGATNAVALYSKDRSAGNTMLGIRGEGTMLVTGTPAAANGSIPMEVDGTTVYVPYSTTAPS